MNDKCKVLIFSNECISNATSNGRTLRNFLVGWPKECLAQFFVKSGSPDFSVCENYFYVNDKDALRSLFGKRNRHIVYEQEGKEVKQTDEDFRGSNPKKRNAVTMYLRDLAWQTNRWMGKDFYHWVESYSPNIVLLQAGDNGFMLKLAR